MHRKIIPDIVSYQTACALSPSDSAMAAAECMLARNVAASVVVEEGKLVGIVTERDLTRKVLAAGMDARNTPLRDIMTPNPDTLAPDDSAYSALRLMQTRHVRHLPVVENGQVVSMVSIRDLYAAITDELEHDIKETEAYVFGDRYGA
ncbi:CBS domain-containing protein [Magnetospira thiophila]